MLSNATKSTDDYTRYRGVKMTDLLRYVRILPEATEITVFAPDGFSKEFPIDVPDPQTPPNIQYDVKGPYPRGVYYGGLDFVNYAFDPGFRCNPSLIPDQLHMLLGYLRDGDPLTRGRLMPDPKNPGRLVLEGEGPYRLIVPQKVAGYPDRPSTLAPVGDGWDYDANKDHNAGFMVRSVAAIRVGPLPEGTTDFRWTEGGWNLVDNAKVVVYGAIDPATFPVMGIVPDNENRPVPDVRLSFGLLSLGEVAEARSTHRGKFFTRLPQGEYVVIPSKEGYRFEPDSIKIQLDEKGRTQLLFRAVSLQPAP
jgi:hypothetical protein